MKLYRPGSFSLALAIVLLFAALTSFAVSPALARKHTLARPAALVKMSSAHILVTPKGKTLYVFAADSRDKSACSGACARFWPPSRVSKGGTPPTKIAGVSGIFGVITRHDGTRQLTYDGAPLYTFAEDKKAGDMNGQGLVASGGYWWVVVAGGS